MGQKVKKMFGQKCRKCKGFYSNPMPFFFTEGHPEFDDTTPWRDIVVKAIGLWCKPDPPEDNFDEDASGWGSADEEGAVEGTVERPASRTSGGPHPEWLCEMCKVSEVADVDTTPPWWLACNPQRFPYWYGKPDPRNKHLVAALRRIKNFNHHSFYSNLYTDKGNPEQNIQKDQFQREKHHRLFSRVDYIAGEHLRESNG